MIKETREAFASVVQAAIPGINAYDTIPGVSQVPALIVAPSETFAINDLSMGGNARYSYDLFVLVPWTDLDDGQNQLDEYLDPQAPNSVIRAITANPELNGTAEDSNWVKVSKYGGKFEAANVEHIGAVITVEVLPLCQ